MPGKTFVYGELVKMTATFTQNSTNVDPATVTLTIEEPDATELVLGSTSYTNPSTGVYEYLYDAVKAGVVEYRWDSVSPQGAQESWFVVEASRVPTP